MPDIIEQIKLLQPIDKDSVKYNMLEMMGAVIIGLYRYFTNDESY